jgi:uncharacterized Zn finger protein (UPF0148 family)
MHRRSCDRCGRTIFRDPGKPLKCATCREKLRAEAKAARIEEIAERRKNQPPIHASILLAAAMSALSNPPRQYR